MHRPTLPLLLYITSAVHKTVTCKILELHRQVLVTTLSTTGGLGIPLLYSACISYTRTVPAKQHRHIDLHTRIFMFSSLVHAHAIGHVRNGMRMRGQSIKMASFLQHRGFSESRFTVLHIWALHSRPFPSSRNLRHLYVLFHFISRLILEL